MTHPSSATALAQVELGDILTLPDGREQTVRAVEKELPQPVGPMAGWVLAGEVGPAAALLSLPAPGHNRVVVYTPLEDIPPHARAARTVAEGVVSYWSPHLPALSGAMGELGYRVCILRGASEPMVLAWIGRELVVFVKSAVTTPDALRVALLRRDRNATEQQVQRHSALVVDPSQVQRPAHREAAPRRVKLPFLPRR